MTETGEVYVLVNHDLSPFTSNEEVRSYIEATRNWGRWGDEDERGTVNLISPESRVRAARLVRDGVTVSLSRPLATWTGPDGATRGGLEPEFALSIDPFYLERGTGSPANPVALL